MTYDEPLNGACNFSYMYAKRGKQLWNNYVTWISTKSNKHRISATIEYNLGIMDTLGVGPLSLVERLSLSRIKERF